MRPKEERLLWSCAIQRDQNVGNVLFGDMMSLIGNLQSARARKCFEQRRDIIAKLTVSDAALLQHVARQNIKVKLGRNTQMPAVIQDCIDQSRMVQNGIACFDVG